MIRRLPAVERRGVDNEGVLVNHFDLCAELLEHLAHYVDVGDVGDVRKRGDSGSKNGGRHELERGVLRTLNRDLAIDGITTLDTYNFHGTSENDA